MKHFTTPIEAEKHYFPPIVQPQPTANPSVEVQTDLTFRVAQSGVDRVLSDGNVLDTATQTDPPDPAESIGDMLRQISTDSQLEVISKLFSEYALANICLTVPEDFLSLAAKAMAQLKRSERTNVLYKLAKGIGTPREDGSDSRLPTRRMPMGLVEHIANF